MSTTTENKDQAVQYISLSKLELSPLNVRKTAANGDDLKASIAAHGLMQNLSVYPGKKGKYFVFAGGRRLAALKALQAETPFPGDYPVPCQIYTEDQGAELSLAENTVRLAMHPADQFTAFSALIDQGQTAEQVAIRFGTTERQVEKLMRLARLAPVLVQEYREEKLPLESLMAFTVTDDQQRQVAVYESLDEWALERPDSIRRALTAEAVNADSKLAKYVTLETYHAAGGKSRTDLFGKDVYLENPELLQALVSEKLKLAQADLEAEGWQWVQVAMERDWQVTQGCDRLDAEPGEVPPELIDQREAIEAELEAIQQEWDAASEDDDVLLDKIREREQTANKQQGEIEERIAVYQEFDPVQVATAGCYAYIKHDGTLEVERGLVKPEDAEETAQHDAGEASDHQPVEKPKGMPESLKRDLESYRLQVAQAEIAKHPQIAFDLMVYSVAKGVIGSRHLHDGVDIHFRQHWGADTVNKHETAAGYAMAEAKAGLSLAWLEANPVDEAERFRLFMGLSEVEKHAILAYCVATTLQPKLDNDREPTAYDTALALTGGNVAAYWRPTKENFLSRVTSSALLEIGQEIFGGKFSTQYAKAKKSELVALLDKGFANPEKAMDRDKVDRLMNWLPAGMAFREAELAGKPAKAKKKAA